ncbi:DUF2238 domain-containing protein [Paenibacillus athensensis]|uniref:DUF2238 domain-containing protein n=1 Tax=Paenibacillus athensensis TaxID=1967502 RepID=A0A4Y8Q0G0_9BACL|nr:DUF2238 domain-containing protein [Paenibacillus athensensis]MCD1258310.1 DUF2238 domain-containing protein [Paenibacillus athensensis]
MERRRLSEVWFTPHPALRDHRIPAALAVVFTLLWMALAIKPYNRFDWMLENLLIWLTLLILAIGYRKLPLSNVSYALLALFLLLHTFGAHYSYNETPLDPLLKKLLATPRNPYDRLVHFAFGLLLAWPLRELAVGFARVRGMWADVAAAMTVLSCACLYELIEMWVAQLVMPEIGTLFLGTQGDPWDTQHDMEMALYGMLLTLCAAALIGRLVSRSRQRRQSRPVR